MDKVLSKILALSLLGGMSLLLGMIPLKLGQWFKGEDGKRKHETLFSSMLCFGGGLLLATSILHMLPEVSLKIRIGKVALFFSLKFRVDDLYEMLTNIQF